MGTLSISMLLALQMKMGQPVATHPFHHSEFVDVAVCFNSIHCTPDTKWTISVRCQK